MRQSGLLDIKAWQIGGDPFSFQLVCGIEKTKFKRRHVAPRGRLAVLVPDANLPENLCARTERLARPWNEDGLIGNNFSRIPKIRRVGVEPGAGGSGADLPGGLDLTNAVGTEFPRQARLLAADANGILQVFAGERVKADWRKILRPERPNQEEGGQKGKETGHHGVSLGFREFPGFGFRYLPAKSRKAFQSPGAVVCPPV